MGVWEPDLLKDMEADGAQAVSPRWVMRIDRLQVSIGRAGDQEGQEEIRRLLCR